MLCSSTRHMQQPWSINVLKRKPKPIDDDKAQTSSKDVGAMSKLHTEEQRVALGFVQFVSVG